MGVPVPCVCTTCGRTFESDFQLAGEATAQFEHTMSGPCPYCGGMGLIPDGTWRLVSGALAYIQSAQPTPAEARVAVQRFAELAAVQDLDMETLEAELSKMGTFGQSLGAFLRSPELQGVGSIAGILGVLLAALGYFLTMKP